MGDADKLYRYSDLQWDEETPVNADKNTLKQLGEALQRKQDMNYRLVGDEDFITFMNQQPTMSRSDSKQQKDLIKLQKNNHDYTKKNKQLESSMSKFIDNNMIATPNQRLFKLQILKKNSTNDNYFRDQLTDRNQEYSERRIHETNSSRYSLMNSKNSLFEKLKLLNSNTNNNNEVCQDIHSMIQEERQYDQLKERQNQNGNISQTDYMISARERSQQQHIQNKEKQKQEEQAANAEKQAMQAEATSEFKRKVNQVLNQKNKEFIKQFTRMKNESKQKQSEIYTKILEFYQQKNKIDPNEIQLYQDMYINHQKVARELVQHLKSNQSKQDLNSGKYLVLNNTLQSKPLRVSLSAQSQRRKPIDSQQVIKETVNQQSRRRFNTQASPFEINLTQDQNVSQQEADTYQPNQPQAQPHYQQIQFHQQQTQPLLNLQKGHSYSVNHINQVNLHNNQNLNQFNNQPDKPFNDQEILLKQNNHHYDHLVNLRLNRRILSTLRMQKDQTNNQSHKNSNCSYTQPFHAETTNENRGIKQDLDIQPLFTQKTRSKTRSPIKINRTSVVDQYQIANRPLIIPNRSSSNSPIEFRTKIVEQEISGINEQESPGNPQLEKIQRLKMRPSNKKGMSRHISNSQSFLANMFQNQQKIAEFQIPPINQQPSTQTQARKKQQSIIISKEKQDSENEMQIKSSPVSAKNTQQQFNQDIHSFNLVKQIQQNTQNQRHKQNAQQQQNQQNQIDLQGYDQIGINSSLIKQSYSLANNKMSSFMKNKLTNKQTNVSSLSSKLFTKIKERIFMQ